MALVAGVYVTLSAQVTRDQRVLKSGVDVVMVGFDPDDYARRFG